MTVKKYWKFFFFFILEDCSLVGSEAQFVIFQRFFFLPNLNFDLFIFLKGTIYEKSLTTTVLLLISPFPKDILKNLMSFISWRIKLPHDLQSKHSLPLNLVMGKSWITEIWDVLGVFSNNKHIDDSFDRGHRIYAPIVLMIASSLFGIIHFFKDPIEVSLIKIGVFLYGFDQLWMQLASL